MKRILTTILILLIFSAVCFGQDNDSTKFGYITKSEIALKQYPNYPKADAVVLMDIGKSKYVKDINGDPDVEFQRLKRIKIFTDAGILYSKIEIPVWTGGVDIKLKNLKAASYNYENGKLVKTALDPSNIYKAKVKGVGYVVKFAIPNVKKGSIIEYQYQKVYDSYFLPDWNFQSGIPELYSYYEVRMIPYFQYAVSMQAGRTYYVANSYIDKSYRQSFYGQPFYDEVHYFSMRDIPAFKDEEYIPSINDYLKRVYFQLITINEPDGTVDSVMSTWSTLVKNELKDKYVGKYLNQCEGYASRLVKKRKWKQGTETAKFDSIMNYMKSSFSWNGLIGDLFSPDKPGNLVANHEGNSGEINLFTVAMLREAGIDAYPVILSTRKHGVIKYNYPYIHFFNDIIVLANINGKQVLADASCKNCANDRLPVRCINDKGLVLKKKNVMWISLKKTQLSKEVTMQEITLGKDSLKADVKVMANEYEALAFRDLKINNANEFSQNFMSKNTRLIDSTFSIQDQNNRSKAFKLSFSFYGPKTVFNNKIYITPFFNEIRSTNAFSQDQRTYPVDLVYPYKKQYIAKITIPAGYKVDFMPKPLVINNNLCELRYGLSQVGNQLTVVLMYYFKKAIYDPSDYYQLKYMYAQVIKKAHEKIVLSKKAVAMK